jgi:uncharacterized protein
MLRLLILVGLGVLLYRLFKSGLESGQRRAPMPGQGSRQVDDVMVQDPQCGIYFPRREGVSLSIAGQELFFCSGACRDQYQAAQAAER